MKHRVQAGGIVLNTRGEVLIITSKIGKHTFPKGSREKGETALENARREIKEETGITQLALQQELGTLTRPGFTAENTTTPSVIKHIDMFLFTTEQADLQPEDPAIKAADWVPADQVEEVLSWSEEAAFFKQHRATLAV